METSLRLLHKYGPAIVKIYLVSGVTSFTLSGIVIGIKMFRNEKRVPHGNRAVNAVINAYHCVYYVVSRAMVANVLFALVPVWLPLVSAGLTNADAITIDFTKEIVTVT